MFGAFEKLKRWWRRRVVFRSLRYIFEDLWRIQTRVNAKVHMDAGDVFIALTDLEEMGKVDKQMRLVPGEGNKSVWARKPRKTSTQR
ncbi:MAG: hypothetical protein HQL56_01005 [Magnetococcales bacterium]|nr:hypothetical protein [Magnetococcales bacterium]